MIRRFVQYMRAVDTLIDIWLRAGGLCVIRSMSTRGKTWKRLSKRITYRVAIISGIDFGWNFYVSFAPRLLPTQNRLKRVKTGSSGPLRNRTCPFRCPRMAYISGLNHKSFRRFSLLLKPDRRAFICVYVRQMNSLHMCVCEYESCIHHDVDKFGETRKKCYQWKMISLAVIALETIHKKRKKKNQEIWRLI